MNIREVLRDYQLRALDFMVTKKVALEYDDMGLGKTLTTMAAVYELKGYPCLIVCPKFSLMVWKSEIERWLGMDSLIYSGKPKQREQIWKEFITSGCPFLITNYEMVAEIAERSGVLITRGKPTKYYNKTFFKWNAFIADEIHMGGVFNHKTQKYKAIRKITKEIPIRYLLTGTPMRQGCVDLFGPLSIVDPIRFDSYWKYVNRYCTIIQDMFGKSIERNPSNLGEFRSMLSGYMIRRVKEEVLHELPGKQRQAFPVEMNDVQKKIYDELTENLIAEIPESGDFIITPGQLTLLVRQRQILACPKMLGIDDNGSALDAILQDSHNSVDNGKPFAIFTPFRQAVPFIEEEMKKEHPGIKIYKITGGLTAEEFGNAWMSFQKDNYPKKLLICVIKSGASFQATAADTAYFLGYEWDFTLNEQAEDRLNRMGQKNFVNIHYMTYRGTADDRVTLLLNSKKASSNLIVGTPEQYIKQLRQYRGSK